MNYYRKIKTLSEAQNELIAKKIADIYGLVCPEYYIKAYNPNSVYTDAIVYSRDCNELGTFIAPTFLSEASTLYMVWDGLEFKGFDAEQIMPQAVKMYIFDFMLGNFDRYPGNWGLIKNDDEVNVIIFDNEKIFTGEFTPYITSDFDELRFFMGYDRDSVFKTKCNELRNFLETSDNSFIELLEDFLDKVTPEVFKKILEEVEAECNDLLADKERKIRFYEGSYKKFSEILAEYQNGRKKWKENI